MKRMFFVSTGRCGTRRIAELLKEKLDSNYSVIHQVRFARLANVIGTLMYYTGGNETIKRFFYKIVISRYTNGMNLICSDPLIAQILPGDIISLKDTAIIHVTRDSDSFAQSFMRMTRQRFKSFVAHAFIPFWQPGIWPLEILLNKNINRKYAHIQKIKNDFFEKRYGSNPYYIRLDMSELFKSKELENQVNKFFDEHITITESDLSKRANQTKT